ncbi:hypothetical protein BUALT_Bualt16G0109500 [Buddleja alternifolia]|uniref:HHH domain-containing protein n=1 Tax=Buddleja alternifolia TaxID=168488 RepID=A0AAV6WBD9_9LAMI|nr:hypothetical protein BUALT_Bualt16G0109500 [Buddleja alternifolia]
MVATLCEPGKEILSWKLTPLENFLTPDDKYGMIEQVMVDATNQVCLDINLASSHEWHSGLTLGSSQFIDLLDDTRIHPESYSLAHELAKDIYLEDGNDNANVVLEMAIEHVREKPHLLRAVDVHEYAEQKNRLNKKETLNDIRLELIEGFQDRSRLYVESSKGEEFYMVSGESEEALSEG